MFLLNHVMFVNIDETIRVTQSIVYMCITMGCQNHISKNDPLFDAEQCIFMTLVVRKWRNFIDIVDGVYNLYLLIYTKLYSIFIISKYFGLIIGWIINYKARILCCADVSVGCFFEWTYACVCAIWQYLI